MFWQRWLFVLSLVIIAFGVLLALFSATPVFAIFHQLIDPVFFQHPDLGTQHFQAWSYGLLGATMAGWGVFMAFIAHYPFRNKERWAWYCVAMGVLTWYVIDTSISLSFKVTFNAIFNTAVLILVALPLGFTWKEFRG